MSHGGMGAWGRGHAVNFYALDREGVDAVAQYVAEGWSAGECVVVVVTASHRDAIEARLRELGYDPEDQQRNGRLVVRDAVATLATLMHGPGLDVARFRELVGELLDEATRGGASVRAFGEMVALLWQRGDVEAAIELELQWNSILHDRRLSLLCAYPTGILDHAQLVDVRRVCDLHSDLVPSSADSASDGASVDGSHACSRVYLPVAESVPAARHFVVDVLRAWGIDALTSDAALIVSELSTNALRHAVSPFRAVVDRRADSLRIGVEDAAVSPVSSGGLAGAEDVSGRGVAIVEAISQRWGVGPLPGGKVVWAELPLRSSGTRAG